MITTLSAETGQPVASAISRKGWRVAIFHIHKRHIPISSGVLDASVSRGGTGAGHQHCRLCIGEVVRARPERDIAFGQAAPGLAAEKGEAGWK